MKKILILIFIAIGINSYAQKNIGLYNIELGTSSYMVESILDEHGISYTWNTSEKGEEYIKINSAQYNGYRFDGLNIYIKSNKVSRAVFYAADGGSGPTYTPGMQQTASNISRYIENLFLPISEELINNLGEPVALKNDIDNNLDIKLAWYLNDVEILLTCKYNRTNMDGDWIELFGGCWVEYQFK